jgi:hypothetical protein
MLSEPVSFSFVAATIAAILAVTAVGIVAVNKFKDKK